MLFRRKLIVNFTLAFWLINYQFMWCVAYAWMHNQCYLTLAVAVYTLYSTITSSLNHTWTKRTIKNFDFFLLYCSSISFLYKQYQRAKKSLIIHASKYISAGMSQSNQLFFSKKIFEYIQKFASNHVKM